MVTRQPTGGQFFMSEAERPIEEKLEMKSIDVESNLSSLAPSLRKILQMNAQTSEEKFKVLDARDKLYKMMRDKDPCLKRGALIATCSDMCPEKERLLREYQGRGSIFEMTSFSKNSNFNHTLAVKEYARSSADQEEPLPHDLRPVNILTMTMSHLLHNVVDYCELSDENLEEWYMFMWDRTRALRKELTQQGVCSLESVVLVEQCARFHIHCAERLIDQDSAIYDDKINTENLTKCLQTLKYMYKDLAKEDIKCPNEPEFVCYSLLLNLNNSSVFTELSCMPNYLLTAEPIQFALNVMTMWETKNYIRFFNLVKQTTYLNCCLLRRYFGEMRLYAIKTMIRSYCTKNYSPQIYISRFVEALNFEGEEECLNFLSYCHFNFHEIEGKMVVNFDRVQFQYPSSTMSSGRAHLFIESKKQRPLSIVMAGGVMPPRLFENYTPHTSFTPNGDLNPEATPQKELLDFFSTTNSARTDSNKQSSSAFDTYQEREQENEFNRGTKSDKEETAWFSNTGTFAFKDKNLSSRNVFGAATAPTFGTVFPNFNVLDNNLADPITDTFRKIRHDHVGVSSTTNVYVTQGSSIYLKNNQSTIFSPPPKVFPIVTFPPAYNQGEKPQLETKIGLPSIQNSSLFQSVFQSKPDLNLKTRSEEEEERKKLEKERREKEEEDRKRKEEEEQRVLLERQRLQEENLRKELERIEREKREEGERRKKEELARLEREKRNRLEEAAKQQKLMEAKARHLEEMKRQETKRRIEMEYKRKVDIKMSDLKAKMRKWKAKIVFDKWRMKAWIGIEERKMKEYFKELKLKYPPVCTEEELHGNPYGLVIPSVLTFEKLRDWSKEDIVEPRKKLLIFSDDLPLIKVNRILEKPLEDLAKCLGSKLDPFPWKLIISVPDNSECPETWKSIETFVEMHFVEHFRWQFGVEKGPLYCRGGSRGTFRFNISIRRLRGTKLHEGSEPHVTATAGSNALMFFMYECGNEITSERLKAVLKSRSSLPKIPVIIIALNGVTESNCLKKLLDLEDLERSHISKYLFTSILGKHQPVVQLIKCLQLAVANSAPPSPLRINKFSNFFSGNWIDSLWRRVEISLSNFKIVLQEPKTLIEFYNSCIEELGVIFFNKRNTQYTVVAEGFSDYELILPTWTPDYENGLKSFLNRLKLPHWPTETPESCHQLNYRIHQYCKKIIGQNKAKLKNFKWVLYRIIKQSLSWKGLDISCDENIYEILTHFPWIQVFQEISRVITRDLCEEAKESKDFIVIYDAEEVEKFTFESSFIGKLLSKSQKRISKHLSHIFEAEEELDDLNPCLEKDSIVYAYSAAIQRETNKRKREECVEESLDSLFSSPTGKRIILEEEPKGFDFSGIIANFQSMDERLDAVKKRMEENFKILTDFQSKTQ